jgi:fatty-acid desaturase
MKKILVFLLLAVFALSAATPAFAYHHRRHHRYQDGRPIVVFHIPL